MAASPEDRYRFQVIAAWRLHSIERHQADAREYVGRRHRKP